MKRWRFAVGLGGVVCLFAGMTGAASVPTQVGGAAGFGVSRAVRDLPPAELGAELWLGPPVARVIPLMRLRTGRPSTAVPQSTGAMPELILAPSAMASPSLSFEGVSSADNSTVLGIQVVPPDTNGDVGPNHYVQVVNSLVRVFNKAGTPVTAPFRMSSLFTAVGGICASHDDGDPIVLYDPLADRWLISQFAIPRSTAISHQCIAISQTGDPTGAYFLYDFVLPHFNDYPHFGVWPDGYYMTANQFSGMTFLGGAAFAFDRQQMLAGNPNPAFIYFQSAGVAGGLPSDFDGLNPPPAGRPNTFASFTSKQFGDPQDALRLLDFHADFANPFLSTLTERPESPVVVAAFDPTLPPGVNGVPQPASGPALDPISDRLMHRLQYRNFGAQESLVVNHTVTVTQFPYKTGVRYYELRAALPGGAFAVAEQATATGAESRWMGSAAMDNQGNLAVGYSVSSATVFPSIRYAGRLASDPPGGLFQGEAALIDGTGVQTDNRFIPSRWGDYSALAVDPADDCTFWYTNEYYTAAGQAVSPVGWQTRVGSFALPGCTPPPRGALNVYVTDCVTHAPIQGAAVETSNGYFRATDAGGTGTFPAINPDTYTVTASAAGFDANANGVTVSPGGTATLNVCLAPLNCATVAKPVILVGGLKTPPGDDSLTFQGQATLPYPFSPALDPLANGIRLLIEDTAGSIVDVAIPGGAFATPPGTGWTVNANKTRWTYLSKAGGSSGRIFQAIIHDRSAAKPGLVTFVVKGKGGSYAVGAGHLPLTGLIIFDSLATQCGEASFAGPAPLPTCAFNAAGSRLTCR